MRIKGISLPYFTIILWLFVLLFLSLPEASASHIPAHIWNHSKILNPERVLQRMTTGKENAYVLVRLRKPAGMPERKEMDRGDIRERVERSVREVQDRLLNRLQSERVKLTNRFTYLYGFAADVTLQGLEDLLGMDDVVSIEADGILEIYTKQGILLMNASGVRSTYAGSGLSIAVCDTGIDYNHSKLGGGGFPNAKVIGGYDFGGSNDYPASQDGDPMDVHGHGTNCAGIAAGDAGATGDYIGGVAPGARLYALKITHGSGGEAYDSDMIAAWEWCITHKNDQPAHPLLVISTSLGSGGFSSPCDSYSSLMTEAAENVAAAGIALFASAGNSGYCDRIGYPGCISQVISVGAVFDGNLGTLGFCVEPESCAPNKEAHPSCTPTDRLVAWAYSITPDQEPPYSNTAAFLDLFAPSHNAYTTALGGGYTTNFGGTSAACPYAAGAAAVLQSAAREINAAVLSPSEVRSILTGTGDPVTKVKIDHQKRHINLDSAVAALSSSLVPALDLPAMLLAAFFLKGLAFIHGNNRKR